MTAENFYGRSEPCEPTNVFKTETVEEGRKRKGLPVEGSTPQTNKQTLYIQKAFAMFRGTLPAHWPHQGCFTQTFDVFSVSLFAQVTTKIFQQLSDILPQQ